MYCERCNIDFDESLRYCKWCGGTLQERRRVTSELYTCPACSSQVRQGWVFCKSCGARLEAAPATRAPSKIFCPRCGSKMPASSTNCTRCGEDFTQVLDSKPLVSDNATETVGSCWSCGEGLEPNSLYCKSCGSAVYAGPEAAEKPQILCSKCQSYSPAGSLNCQGCGEPLTAASPPAAPPTWMAKPTMVDSDIPSALNAEQLPGTPRIPSGDDAATRRTPVPVPEVDSGAHTFVFTTGESQARAETTDDLASETAAEQGSQDEEAEAAWRRESAETNMLPGVAGAPIEKPAPTTSLKKTRITAPVEGETTSTIEEQREDDAAPFAPPEPSLPLSPMPTPPSDQATLNLEASFNAPASPAQPTLPTPAAEPHVFSEPAIQRPAPVGVSRPVRQPRPPRPGTRPRANPVAVVSVIVGLAVLASAAFVIWWYLSGGTRAKPPEPTVTVETPTSAPPAPVQPPPEPPVPVGMVKVTGGTYTIGRNGRDPASLEEPAHQVEIKSFYIDRTEVTNADYLKFIEATGHPAPHPWQDGAYPAGDDRLPVTDVTWQDAASYAEWAGKRLPTEAEWEVAARGSDGRIYPWGNRWQPGIANIGLKSGKIEEVGKYPDSASPFGALDMIGNVWEWTADEISRYPGSQAPITTEPGSTYRVIRGGAFDGSSKHDASYRGYLDATRPYPKVGFRCVKDAG